MLRNSLLTKFIFGVNRTSPTASASSDQNNATENNKVIEKRTEIITIVQHISLRRFVLTLSGNLASIENVFCASKGFVFIRLLSW